MNCNEFKTGQEVVTTFMDYGIPVGTKGVITNMLWKRPKDSPYANGGTSCYSVRFPAGLVRWDYPPTPNEEEWAFLNTELRPYEEAAPAAEEYRIYKDGSDWCAVGPGFKCLSTDPAGFGSTPESALRELLGTAPVAAPAVPIAEVLLDDGWRSDAQDSGV